MNIFSTELFFKTFNDTYFPNESLALQDFNINNKVWRIPVLPNGKPMTSWPFLDFHEPLELSTQGLSEKKLYIHRACLGKVSSNEWFDKNLHIAYKAAPLIDWTMFSQWSDFEQHVSLNSSQHFPGTEKLKRKLTKNLGATVFLRHDPRPEVLQACFEWKSAQFPSIKKSLEDSKNILFFKNLIAKGLVVVSSLSAGETLLAANICAVWDQRFYSWISAYNIEHSKYGTGRVLLDFLLKESYSRGEKEYDFLLGNESYKWIYATHTRLIGEISGYIPITKTWVKEQFISHPKVFEKMKILRSKSFSSI